MEVMKVKLQSYLSNTFKRYCGKSSIQRTSIKFFREVKSNRLELFAVVPTGDLIDINTVPAAKENETEMKR